MSKNKGKGGKSRRRGRNDGDDKRELTLKEEGTEYAKVTRMLGNGRLEAACLDGITRLCHIRGKMHKKIWIGVGDIILVSLRDFQDSRADVILRYTPAEARELKAKNHLPESMTLNDAGGEEGNAAGFDFEDFQDDDTDDDDDSIDLDNI